MQKCRECYKLNQGGESLCKHLRRKWRCKQCKFVKANSGDCITKTSAPRRRRVTSEVNKSINLNATTAKIGSNETAQNNAGKGNDDVSDVNGAYVTAVANIINHRSNGVTHIIL